MTVGKTTGSPVKKPGFCYCANLSERPAEGVQMEEDLKWLIGSIFAAIAAIGGLIGRDRQIMKNIAEGDAKIYERLSRIQAEYVRKEDLNHHITRIETGIDTLREEQRDTNRRIDKMLHLLAKQSGNDYDA